MPRKTYNVPVLLKNLRGYDSPMIEWGLRSFPRLDNNLMGQGIQKYLTVGCGAHLLFQDILQFLARSLETLASNLLSSGTVFFKKLAPH